MTNKSKARHGIRRGRKFTLNPTSRAIRHAFALGLALAASGPLLAGTCDVSDPANAVCDGDFVGSNISFAIDDLTIVVGGDLPTVIQPLDGVIGIDLYAANGDISLTSAADIVTNYGAAISVQSSYGDVSVVTSGNVMANHADGINVVSGAYGSTSATNGGELIANDNNYGNSSVNGAFVGGYYSALDNNGHISAQASSVYGISQAVGVYDAGYDATTNNVGLIEGSSYAETGSALAIGEITAANRFSTFYNGDNGTVSADASVGFGVSQSYGALVYGNSALLINHGAIFATSETLAGTAYATGSKSKSSDGFAVTQNYGVISSHATTSDIDDFTFVIGASTQAKYGAATLVNHGDISATAIASGNYGSTRVFGAYTSAQYAAQYNYANISANASVGHNGTIYAFGAYVSGKYSVTDTNHGSISVDATSQEGYAVSRGIVDSSSLGNTYTVNFGDISAITHANADYTTGYGGYATAYGEESKAKYFSYVYNAGSISASAYAPLGLAHAEGASVGAGDYVNVEDSVLINNGDISAYAQANHGDISYNGYSSIAVGANVLARDYAVTINQDNGVISATANADYGVALAFGSGTANWGIYGRAYLVNNGDINATANAYAGSAYATGANLRGTIVGATYNHGSISATANAEYGHAVAVGSGTAVLYNYMALLVNTGDISATANAYEGVADAMGATVSAGNYANIYNSADGVISATATGYYGTANATGLTAISQNGDISIVNAGSITATANTDSGGSAIAVDMRSYSSNTLHNYGSIIAAGANSEHVAVSSSASAYANIYNYGNIDGSIITGALDDHLINNASGVIALRNGVIDLGDYSANGNTFINDGTIVVNGDSQISMGNQSYSNTTQIMAINSSQNPLPTANSQYAFYNAGSIDMQNGATTDVLSVFGDLAGNGAINVDANTVSGASDQFNVIGSVSDDSVTTINVDFVGVPTTATSDIQIVHVSGDSVAGNFVLGNVGFANNNFLAMDFSLGSNISANNATDDIFYLGVNVAGLSDAGSLAASIAPGVQSLMNAQVGTWSQREGVIDQFDKHAMTLWGRVFVSKGTINPEQTATNFGQGGNFDFDQTNSGMEVGADFAISDQFSLGVLLNRAIGNQLLNGAGFGADNIYGDSYGLYGTWISPAGFYIDGSYRWMNFTANIISNAISAHTDGDANTFNVEAGYAWTLASGLKVEPQFQYTQTHVGNVDPVSLGQTEFKADNGDSATGRLGVMIRKSFAASAGGTVWTPYASINAVREFDGKNSYSINNDFNGSTSIEGTSALVEGGFNAQTGNLSVYGGLNWQDGGALKTFFGGQLGIRYTWGHSQ